MKSRLLVAAVGIPLLLIILFLCPPVVTVLAISALSAIGAYELLHATGIAPHKRMVAYGMIMAFLVPLWSHFSRDMFLAAVAFAIFAAVLFVEALAAYPNVKFSAVSGAFFGGLFIPLCLSAVARILVGEHGKYLVVVPLMIPFISDAGGYFAGMLFGKHKLAPVLSPKKTREGAIGSLVVTALVMVIYGLIMQFGFHLTYNYLYGIIYGIAGSLISIIGDLSFSMIKREVGIKDYGKLFVSHGGVLDRFDSVIFAAPVVEILLRLIPLFS